MQAPKLEFWYDFASTYAYLSALRIKELAARAGVDIIYKPFLLGPIFREQGWNTSPFNIYPAKGRYMVRDIERLTAERGLHFRLPDRFPQNSLAAARLALAAEEAGCIAAFTHAVFVAEFAEGQDISNTDCLSALVAQLTRTVGLDPAKLLARSVDPAIKDRLKVQSADAVSFGLFGSPSFRASDGELFWGDDRLEQALTWAQTAGRGTNQSAP